MTDRETHRPDARPARRRFLPSISVDDLTADDVGALSKDDQQVLLASSRADVTHFTIGLSALAGYATAADLLAPQVRALPRVVRGLLRQPDGAAAERVGVSPALPGGGPEIGAGVLTDSLGVFRLSLPSGLSDVQRAAIVLGGLDLAVRGDGNQQRVNRPLPPRNRGALGAIVLAKPLRPLPRSVLGALLDLLEDFEAPADGEGTEEHPRPAVQLGEGLCSVRFDEDRTQRRYPYRLLVRLVEPRTTTVTRVFQASGAADGVHISIPLHTVGLQQGLGLTTRFVDRAPLDRPIAVDQFRNELIGNVAGTIEGARKLPVAGTLGLGYVLNLAQTWRFDGLSLGNLVYSLPLAPGEQQCIAISEQTASASVRESELLSADERQRSRTRQDASTSSVFSSAFEEHVEGHSDFENSASSSGWGVAAGAGSVPGIPLLVGAGTAFGGGGAENSGEVNTELDGSRHYTARAAEDMHSSVEREAAARRRSSRTAIRLATETERETVTTKVITNHNHTRALTIQYWEVLRHFQVGTDVEGVTLVCFVPMDVVRFLAAGQPLALDPKAIENREDLIDRYSVLHEHADAIGSRLPARHRGGLRLLDDFLANPRAGVDLAEAAASTVLNVSLTGTFLPFERVWVAARLRSGGVLGRVPLDGPLTDLRSKEFTSRTELTDELRRRREDEEVTVTATLPVPDDLDLSEIVGFELSRSFRKLDYELAFDEDVIEALDGLAGAAVLARLTDVAGGVHLSPGELEGLLGGPIVHGFGVMVNNGVDITADGLTAPRELPPVPLPLPATDRQPTLTFRDVLKIERTLRHVVRNTMSYSKVVWASLTPEERVVMLEGFTIGLPARGLPDAALDDPSQHVPLLNCVANQVLGFHGNCMIMPFSIPPAFAAPSAGGGDNDDDTPPLTTGRVQEALTAFHRSAFSPPVSHVSLPTSGVLGEAVLGHCPSAEKIDLTRFWNWADSPSDVAPTIGAVPIRQGLDPGLLTVATPTAPTSIITTVTGSDSPTAAATSLISELGKAGKAEAPFTPADFLATGVMEKLGEKTMDQAEAARKDALQQASNLATAAITAVSGIRTSNAAAEKAASEKAVADNSAAEKAAAEKAKADAESEDKRATAGAATLKESADGYLAAGSGQPDQAGADALAASIVSSLFGDSVPIALVAPLFPLFDKAGDGGRTQGSRAFLKALGLLTE